ncbi:MAG: hypothetical protein ACJ77J_05490, partial [Gemmatimonadaceae bacterium]
MSISRRKFVGVSVTAAAGVTLNPKARAEVLDGASHGSTAMNVVGRPVVVSSANGIRGVARAYDMIARQNADTLDA